MVEFRKRCLAAAAVFGIAMVGIGAGVRFSAADEPGVADLADLRDAVQAASKRGENVDEVARALAALEKVLVGGWKPKERDQNGPPELQAVRQAAEAAGRKGENVEEIIKQLEVVEKKLTGRVQTAPKPVPPPLGDPKPEPRPRTFRGEFPIPRVQPFVLPDRGIGGGVDREALQKAMDLRMKAMELLLQDVNDPKAMELAQQATEMMLKAIGGGRGILAPELLLPEAFGQVPDRVRLGVRMEKPGAVLVEQLGLDAGRGIAIVEVIPGTAAEKAGFKTHDIVLEFDGKPVSDAPEDFNRQVTAAKSGVKLTAVVLRKGKKVELQGIELPEIAAARPDGRRDPQLFPLPGIELPLPEARPVPIRPLPRPPIGDRNGRGVGGNSTSVVNGNFTIRSSENGVQFELKGTTTDAGTKLTEALIDDNGMVHKADAIEKVPEQFRPMVEKLLKNVGSRTARKRD